MTERETRVSEQQAGTEPGGHDEQDEQDGHDAPPVIMSGGLRLPPPGATVG